MKGGGEEEEEEKSYEDTRDGGRCKGSAGMELHKHLFSFNPWRWKGEGDEYRMKRASVTAGEGAIATREGEK
jgi:hypothetical protein